MYFSLASISVLTSVWTHRPKKMWKPRMKPLQKSGPAAQIVCEFTSALSLFLSQCLIILFQLTWPHSSNTLSERGIGWERLKHWEGQKQRESGLKNWKRREEGERQRKRGKPVGLPEEAFWVKCTGFTGRPWMGPDRSLNRNCCRQIPTDGFYLENKPTKHNVLGGVALRMHGGSCSVPHTPQETRDFGFEI